jgi:hypothetical protein
MEELPAPQTTFEPFDFGKIAGRSQVAAAMGFERQKGLLPIGGQVGGVRPQRRGASPFSVGRYRFFFPDLDVRFVRLPARWTLLTLSFGKLNRSNRYPICTGMRFHSQADLDAALAKWQAILSLQDWEIRATLIHHPDRQIDNSSYACVGQCAVSFKLKQATIRILSDGAAFTYPEQAASLDHELTPVHELLHVHFHPFEPSKDLVRELWEQTIEVLARRFVALARRGQLAEDQLAAALEAAEP